MRIPITHNSTYISIHSTEKKNDPVYLQIRILYFLAYYKQISLYTIKKVKSYKQVNG